MVALTPDGLWNPNDETYTLNEDAFLDWQGDLILPLAGKQCTLDLSQVPLDNNLADSMNVSALETAVLDAWFTGQEVTASEFLVDPLIASICALDEELDTRMMTKATILYEDDFLFDMSSVSDHSDSRRGVGLGDDYFVSSMTASSIKGVTPDHLSKV